MTGPILIWGAGAVGGTLGATFIRAGREVIFVDTDVAHVDAINAHGLRVQGPVIDETVKARAVLPEALDGKFERSFLCVRAGDSETAGRALVEHLLSDGYVVSAQDGLNESVISRIVGDHRVIGCALNFSAEHPGPGLVSYAQPGSIVVGELGGKFSDRAESIYTLMALVTPEAIVTSNIWGFLWSRLIRNTLLSGLALSDGRVCEILADPVYRAVLRKLALEVATVAAVNNVTPEPFGGFDPSAFGPLATDDRSNAGFDTMAADGALHDGTLSRLRAETAAQLQPALEIGQSLRIPMPLIARLIAMVREIEGGKRQLSPENVAELARTAP